jgi:TonB family protein
MAIIRPRRSAAGTVSFRLDVTPEGRVSRCEVTMSSGSPALDAATCRIMTERPQFEPAHDRNGRAVADTVSSRIRWVLPTGGEAMQPPTVRAASVGELSALVRASDYPAEAVKDGQQGPSAVVLLVSPEGKAIDCGVLYPSGSALLDETACRILRERSRFTPARYADGSAAWDTVPVVVPWKLPNAR